MAVEDVGSALALAWHTLICSTEGESVYEQLITTTHSGIDDEQ